MTRTFCVRRSRDWGIRDPRDVGFPSSPPVRLTNRLCGTKTAIVAGLDSTTFAVTFCLLRSALLSVDALQLGFIIEGSRPGVFL